MSPFVAASAQSRRELHRRAVEIVDPKDTAARRDASGSTLVVMPPDRTGVRRSSSSPVRAPRSARPTSRPRSRASCGHAASIHTRASPCSRSRPATRSPTPTCSRRRRARPPSGCARDTAGSRCRWRRRWPPTRSGFRRSRSRDLVRELDAPATGVTLVEGAGGLLLPARARRRHARTDRRVHAGDASCSSPTPGSARSTSCGSAHDALAGTAAPVVYLNRFDDARRPAPPQRRVAPDARGPRDRDRPRGPRCTDSYGLNLRSSAAPAATAPRSSRCRR